MKNKFIKAMAAVISCAAVISTGLATTVSVSASYKDSDWYTETSTLAWREYKRPKDTDSCVYISNSGKYMNSSGNYVSLGTCDAVLSVRGDVLYNNAYYMYLCTDNAQNSYSTHYNCYNLRIGAYETRVVYQYIKENFYNACSTYNIPSSLGKCYAQVSFRTDNDKKSARGQWSPDTIGSYPQISGQ